MDSLIKFYSSNSSNTDSSSPMATFNQIIDYSPSSSQFISFGSLDSSSSSINVKEEEASCLINYGSCGSKEQAGDMGRRRPIMLDDYRNERVKGAPTGNGSSAQEHALAEKRRREKLNQKFIALSASVPRLKKMDKATILEDAVGYIKQLEERVKTLEGQVKQKGMESIAFVKESAETISTNNGDSSTCGLKYFDSEASGLSQPEIEVRISERSVLIRIHCERNQGLVANILNQLQKLHLNIVNSNVMLFGNHAMDMTIISEADDDFSLTVKDLFQKLRRLVSP